MNRRQLIKAGVLGGLGWLAAPMLNLGRSRLLGGSIEVSTRAIDTVLATTVVDMLGLLTLDWPTLFRWQRSPATFAEPAFRQIESSGVNIFNPAVETSGADAHRAVLRWMAGWRKLLSSRPCYLSQVDTITDLLMVPARGTIGVMIGFQNSDHFRSVKDVQGFYRLGQRVSQLTYNSRNRLGSGCYEAKDRGLTDFGADVVREMNRLGMVVDLSHCGERTSRDAIALSSQPVLITHANCRALVPGHPRCKSDGLIRQLAAADGVMGITAVRAFVSRSPAPTIEDLLNHFDHVAKIVGIEHVGLGSDVDVTAIDPKTGSTRPFYRIRGLDPVARVFQIAEGLLGRGYSTADVELVLGGNFLRVLAKIWPDASWSIVPATAMRRDPFCPAPMRAYPRSSGRS